MKRYLLLVLATSCMVLFSSFAMANEATEWTPEPPAIIEQVEIFEEEEIANEDTLVYLFPVSTDVLEEEEPVIELRYGFTEDEVYLLAQLLCGDGTRDGDGEYDIDYQAEDKINYYEVSKVLSVVMNRVRDGRFPSTVTDVVLAHNQFHVFPKNLKAVPSERALRVIGEWCDAYDTYDDGAQVVPENHIYFYGNGYINITRAG